MLPFATIIICCINYPMQQSISIAFQTDKPLSAYGPLAASAENHNFDTITVYNDMLYQPAWLPLLEIAKATSKINIGVAAVNPFTSHPINIAGNIALIDEASNGRAYLGIARGAWLDFVGVEPKRPLTAMRESFAAVRHLLSGSKEPLAGDIYPIAGGDSLRWDGAVRPKIPFLLGTWGVKTMQACLPYVNQIKRGGTANSDVVPWCRQQVGPDIGIVIGAVCVVSEDGAAARQLARREVALYLPVVAALDPTVTIDPDRLAKLNAAAANYDFDLAATYISDDLLQKFAFAGTPSDIAKQTLELFEAGANCVEYGTPHGLSADEGLRLLGEQVLPQVKEVIRNR